MEAHAAELAYHFAEAEPVLGADKLARYSLLAGEQALSLYAQEEAQVHFERALAARGIPLSGTEPATDEEIAALLFGLGRSRLATLAPGGQNRELAQKAISNLTLAFDYYATAGDVARAVAIAVYPVSLLGLIMNNMGQLVARALKLVPQDSYEAGRLLSRAGWYRGRTETDYGSASEAFDRALTIAQREGDTVLEMETLAAAAEVALFHLRVGECYSKARQALGLAQQVDSPRAEVQAQGS